MYHGFLKVVIEMPYTVCFSVQSSFHMKLVGQIPINQASLKLLYGDLHIPSKQSTILKVLQNYKENHDTVYRELPAMLNGRTHSE